MRTILILSVLLGCVCVASTWTLADRQVAGVALAPVRPLSLRGGGGYGDDGYGGGGGGYGGGGGGYRG